MRRVDPLSCRLKLYKKKVPAYLSVHNGRGRVRMVSSARTPF